MPYNKRTYRNSLCPQGLESFKVSLKETDLFISASRNLFNEALDAVSRARRIIERHITKNSAFATALAPLADDPRSPPLIRRMLKAAAAAGVGPMAAVAGAVAEYTGRRLLRHCEEVIVENGGDIFISMQRPVTVAIFAGPSPLSDRLGIRLEPAEGPLGICTSSATVGPSLSYGKADAVTVKSGCASHADAAATALGNMVKRDSDVQKALDAARGISGVKGVVIIRGKNLGVWGDVKLVQL